MQPHPWITGRTIVVTGAAGSIGSALCQRLLAYRPAALRCLNLTEHGLAQLARRLRDYAGETRITYTLGSVLDSRLLSRLCTGADVVIHAAAYKFVDVCEANPCVAVQNNVEGTVGLLRIAHYHAVGRTVLISSDKAYQACSVMGKTKALAERLVAGMGAGSLTVRFGNVLDSAGSVLPIWREQIAHGMPVTLTDPDCERYFMTVDDACDLILETLALPDTDQGTYVFDMGARRRMGDLLNELTARYPFPVPVQITGLRPGERLIEELTAGCRCPTAHPRVFQVPSAAPLPSDAAALVDLLRSARNHEEAATRRLLTHLASEQEA